MVRVVHCHAGVLGSNPGGPKDFSLWNYFNLEAWFNSSIFSAIKVGIKKVPISNATPHRVGATIEYVRHLSDPFFQKLDLI